MGWGCYKHEADAGSDSWKEKAGELSEQKLESGRATWGRDGEVCPWCWEELEEERDRFRKALETISKGAHNPMWCDDDTDECKCPEMYAKTALRI